MSSDSEDEQLRKHYLAAALRDASDRFGKQQGTLAGQGSECCSNQTTACPKPWVACSIEEKIERLRERIKEEQNERRYIFARMSDLQRQVGRLNGHTHDGTGRAVVWICDDPTVNGFGEPSPPAPADPNLVYF